jgi:S-adenosylmethionine decarboxylase
LLKYITASITTPHQPTYSEVLYPLEMISHFTENVSKSVNKDLAVELDSTHAFEGPEKLLEIWFADTPEMVRDIGMPKGGLRSVPRSKWVDVLDHVQCKVLSVVNTPDMDAYVLSESSLFVFPHKVILKTCGTTTLLVGLDPLLRHIKSYTGFGGQPPKVFYSRKSFMFPDRQLHPHRSWHDEVVELNKHFKGGCAYVVGNVASDHWYLYTALSGIHLPKAAAAVETRDQTLEIMMTELSHVYANQFFVERLPGGGVVANKETVVMSADEDMDGSIMSDVSVSSEDADAEDPGHALGALCTRHTGIDQIYPTKDQLIDAFMFAPCGYSCNAVFAGGKYFTIHVTPEQGFSYASFESNVCASDYGTTNQDVVEKVVDIFRPGKFSMTLFESKSDEDADSAQTLRFGNLDGYTRTDRILYELGEYQLLFVTFDAIRALK